ncbi:hypothetical protein CBM2586_A10753 [Cupriavidus phytorum]|uniref:Uncharacterized protein n=1 Tax=Cupriavidus taiwanensis TaxID=164546 RepID=A0A375BAT9_9BURK|nr:hypothetical protein CBM2586_A10753 [Cupriavidus taiwanensis]
MNDGADSAPECESEAPGQALRTARKSLRRSPSVSSTLLLWWIQTQAQTLGFFFACTNAVGLQVHWATQNRSHRRRS